MIKKFLLAIMIALPMCAMAQTKIGVINADVVFQAMPETALAQTTLQNVQKQYEDALNKLREEGQKLITEYQAMEKDATVPAGIKERKAKDIQDCEVKIQQFMQTADQDMQKQQQQLIAPIREKIMNAVKAVGEENGFSAIWPEGVAIYIGKDIIDITPMVKAKLGIK